MSTSIEWYLTKTSYGSDRLDRSPQRICIAWKDDGVVVRMAEYTLREIDEEILRCECEEGLCEVLVKAREELFKASE